MKLPFYLDESGNSGDVIFREDNNRGISNDPFFALAGVGIPQDENIDGFLNDLKKKHKVQAKDLKVRHVFNKPKFIQELLEKIVESKYPLFIELMDKRYFVAANIASFYFIRHLFIQSPVFANLGRDLAALIANDLDEIVIAKYSQMCLEPSKQHFIEFARAIYQEFTIAINKGVQLKELLSLYLTFLASDIEEIQSGELDERIIEERFIPPQDKNKRGEVIAMLPHVNAFTNLYARINNVVHKDIDLDIFHDEQLYLDEIIKHWEKILRTNEFYETLKNNWNKNLDFKFSERFKLQFVQSDVCSGIQVADVVAGFCTKYCKVLQEGNKELVESHSATVDLIRELSDSGTGQGLNIVGSKNLVMKFYFPYSQN